MSCTSIGPVELNVLAVLCERLAKKDLLWVKKALNAYYDDQDDSALTKTAAIAKLTVALNRVLDNNDMRIGT